MTNEYSIAVLLPTRARTDALTKSVTSIINQADNLETIQIIFGFDNDDTIGLNHFTSVIQPILDKHSVSYEAMAFDSMGYAGLNRYYNYMSQHADADWLFVWNDDAVMNTKGWDTVISKYTGQFRLLKVHTHLDHPYSIFPIVPRAWADQMKHLSRHQMIDAELSQMAFCLDLMEVIEVDVTHEQSELTGQDDDTSKSKIRFEGNPLNPYDFHNPQVSQQRYNDCESLSRFMHSIGIDITFWENVKAGKQYPWEKLIALDVNKQMSQFSIKVNDRNEIVSLGADDQANVARKANEQS